MRESGCLPAGRASAAPAWAGVMAIVNQGRALAGEMSFSGGTQTVPALYALPSTAFHKVAITSSGGSNQAINTASYNTQTGLGTPNGSVLIGDLVGVGTSASAPTSPTSTPSAPSSPPAIPEPPPFTIPTPIPIPVSNPVTVPPKVLAPPPTFAPPAGAAPATPAPACATGGSCNSEEGTQGRTPEEASQEWPSGFSTQDDRQAPCNGQTAV